MAVAYREPADDDVHGNSGEGGLVRLRAREGAWEVAFESSFERASIRGGCGVGRWPKRDRRRGMAAGQYESSSGARFRRGTRACTSGTPPTFQQEHNGATGAR